MNTENVEPENSAAGFPLETFVMPCGVDLMDFCADYDDLKFGEPCSDDLHTYATNGHVAVRVSRIDSVSREVTVLGMPKLFDNPLPDGRWVDLPKINMPEKSPCGTCKGLGKACECDECDGQGEVEWWSGRYDYTAECKDCHGDGSLPGGDKTCTDCSGDGETYRWNEEPISIFESVNIHVRYADILSNIGGLEVFDKVKDGVLRFRFPGGEGIVITMAK